MEEIRVIIDEEGGVKISTHGFKGRSCIEATKGLEEDLGVKTLEILTAEYREQEVTNENRNHARR